MTEILTKKRGVAIAERFKERLIAEGIPIEGVYLFGSLAHGTTQKWSDIDIAVVHTPFARTRSEERRKVRSLRDDFSVPMDIICLHPDDFENRYFGLAQEVQRNSILIQ